jgi:hypothetical protein
MLCLLALVLLASDSLVPVNRFAVPFGGANYAIMASHYVAQYLLTWDARQSALTL